MRRAFTNILRLTTGGLAAFLVLAAPAPHATGQVPGPFGPLPNVAAQSDGVEVLARGPVHEGFAATAEFPTPGAVAPKLPPDPVEELPPDQRPAGDNVQWIPGYWQYDEERTDFIYVSGFWRVPPPNHVWFPGSWRPLPQGGAQWTSGFWQTAVAEQVRANFEYLPPPPQSLETGPVVPAPDQTSIYVPGCWVYRERYLWRSGFFIDHRPGWVFVPAHYRWTPGGYVFIDGYWDYPLDTRGVLFAPVALRPAVYNVSNFVYTPQYAVSQQCMVSALFVRRGTGSYYFGDYFESRYAQAGYDPWIGRPRGGFALSVNVNINRGYVPPDPLFSYYQANYRQTPNWNNQISEVYAGRFRGDLPRPPRTLVQQTTVINNITNVNNTNLNNSVTNNTVNNTVVKNRVNNSVNNNQVTNNNVNTTLAMVQPLSAISRNEPAVNLQRVDRAARVQEQALARQVREVGVARQRAENLLADTRGTAPVSADRPRQAAVAVPRQLVNRAVAPVAAAQAPPPNPERNRRAVPVPTTPVAPAATQPRPGQSGYRPPVPGVTATPAAPVAQPPAQQNMRPNRPNGTTPPRAPTAQPQVPQADPTPTPTRPTRPNGTIPPKGVTPRPAPQPQVPQVNPQPTRPNGTVAPRPGQPGYRPPVPGAPATPVAPAAPVAPPPAQQNTRPTRPNGTVPPRNVAPQPQVPQANPTPTNPTPTNPLPNARPNGTVPPRTVAPQPQVPQVNPQPTPNRPNRPNGTLPPGANSPQPNRPVAPQANPQPTRPSRPVPPAAAPQPQPPAPRQNVPQKVDARVNRPNAGPQPTPPSLPTRPATQAPSPGNPQGTPPQARPVSPAQRKARPTTPPTSKGPG